MNTRPTEVKLKPLKAVQKSLRPQTPPQNGNGRGRVTRLRLEADLRPTGTHDECVVQVEAEAEVAPEARVERQGIVEPRAVATPEALVPDAEVTRDATKLPEPEPRTEELETLVLPRKRPAPVEIDTGETVTLLMEPEEMRNGPQSAASTRRAVNARTTQRDFIICYDGVFVGHFRSQRRISNRSSFKLIAQQLMGILGPEFDPDKLELFKPVALKLQRPPFRDEIADGEFNWFITPVE